LSYQLIKQAARLSEETVSLRLGICLSKLTA